MSGNRPARWRSRCLPAAALAAATAAVTIGGLGCTAAGSTPADGPPGEPTAAHWETLEHAEALLIGPCMKGKGFRYTAVPPAEQPPRQPDFPYGIDDTEFARTHGFGTDLDRELLSRAEKDPNRVYFQGLDASQRAAYSVALTGTERQRITVTLPSGFRLATNDSGCLAEARRRLYGDYPAWFKAARTVENLKTVYQSRALEDPAYAAAVKDWSACMAGHDWTVKDPQELRVKASAAARDVPTENELARERAAAEAEAACVRTTGLVTTATRVEQRYRTQLEQTHRDAIRTRDRLAAAALPRARQLVDDAR
ncbi:hypothetical protein ACIQNK_30800 [Streptomyces sp. NPDC091273]|uniref:hypothetical protein n=1 Tax=Streptomyces sp. NPDC091273 TaxID=3365982 RepID=UPI00380438D5